MDKFSMEGEGHQQQQPQLLQLGEYVVGRSLPTIMYVPDFITQSEQSLLLNHIYGVPASRWKCLKNRRLQNWGGVVHEKGLLPQEMPYWLTMVTQRICEQTGLFPSPINHVLINEYLPNQGIMPHQDGPSYYPVVAILSLGAPVVINYTPHQRFKEHSSNETSIDAGTDDLPTSSVLLMPRSLLIFKDSAYTDYLHGIDDSEIQSLDKAVNIAQFNSVRGEQNVAGLVASEHGYMLHRTSTRVSLTCRLVPKVHKNLFKQR